MQIWRAFTCTKEHVDDSIAAQETLPNTHRWASWAITTQILVELLPIAGKLDSSLSTLLMEDI